MIGALLIVFFLAIVFLTRPYKKRDRYLLDLWRVVKKSVSKRFVKKGPPISTPIPSAVKRDSKIKISIDDKSYPPSTFAGKPLSPELLEMTNRAVQTSMTTVIADRQSDLEIESDSPTSIPEYFPQAAPAQVMEPKITYPVHSNTEQSTILKSELETKENESIKQPITLDASEVINSHIEFEEKKNEVMHDHNPKEENDLKPGDNDMLGHINLDDSIIDIDQTYQLVDYETTESQQAEGVPEWAHTYIYSYTDLDRATTAQVKFYHRLKEKFLQGSWIDIGNNSNYAFILLFNLLREFNTHQDMKLLEEQFDRLGGYFPKTASYANRFLIQKMRDVGDTDGLNRLEWSIASNRTDLQSWDWKERYTKRLGLSKADGKLLEDFYPPSNSFLWNDTCATEVVKLYIQLRKELQISYKKNKLEQADQFTELLDILAREQYNFRTGSQNYQYTIKHGTSTIWELMFKYCEAKIRQHYACTKTLSFLASYQPEFQASLHQQVLSHVEQKIDELVQAVAPPTEELEVELNASFTTRWKVSFDLSQTYYEEFGPDAFLARAEEILRRNSANPSLELIHLEISKNLMLCDRQLSFDHYLKYVGQNLKGSRLVLKAMSQKMMKKLFSNPEQQTAYFTLMTSLIRREVSVEDALGRIKDFYMPKRKRITLDSGAIKTVEVQHTGTVELLNEYLNDEDITLQELPASLPEEKQSETHKYKVDLRQTEVLLIALFEDHGFKLDIEQLAVFCRENGAMAGPLVNNLNETCYELLDDLLIEQDENIYTINPTYYAQITTP